MRILVVNAGSSSLKLSVLEGEALRLSETVPAPGGRVDESAVRDAVDRGGSVDAVGHRIVHGGSEFNGPVLVDERVAGRLHALTDLAPLHQPKSLRALELVGRLLPDAPAVACFDTAFHANLPAAASTYALPARWRQRWGLRRFGFHGLSHAYVSRRAAALSGAPGGDTSQGARLRIVTCHLGSGASLAAVKDGTSVDTTMGFTPLEGLVMATRSGTVDPGLVLWLEEHTGMPPSELASALEHRSGLLGLAGMSDMKAVLDAEQILYCVGGRTAVGIEPAGDAYTNDRFVQQRVGLHHLSFRARNREDVDKLYDKAVSLGAKIVHAPEEGPWAPGYYSVLFEDPDGIRLEMNFVPGKGLLEPKS